MKSIIFIFLILQISFYSIAQIVEVHTKDGLIHSFNVKDVDKIKINTENGSLSDINGNVYNVVKIGNQWWMVDNLVTNRYNDGECIPYVSDSLTWAQLVSPGYCFYDNDENTNRAYGALYNWYTVNTQKLCPVDWKVPSDADWTELTDYLGGLSIAGGPLKEVGNEHWEAPNAEATNLTGFSALAIGGRNASSEFWLKGQVANFWSSTMGQTDKAMSRNLHYNSALIDRMETYKVSGISVRCMKNMK